MKIKNGIDEIYNAIHKENLRYHASLYEKKTESTETKSSPASADTVKSFNDKSKNPPPRELAK